MVLSYDGSQDGACSSLDLVGSGEALGGELPDRHGEQDG
jgi:hypothetical protein